MKTIIKLTLIASIMIFLFIKVYVPLMSEEKTYKVQSFENSKLRNTALGKWPAGSLNCFTLFY